MSKIKDLGSHHTLEFTKDEYTRLLSLLKWVGVACVYTDEEKAVHDNIIYKLRSHLKTMDKR